MKTRLGAAKKVRMRSRPKPESDGVQASNAQDKENRSNMTHGVVCSLAWSPRLVSQEIGAEAWAASACVQSRKVSPIRNRSGCRPEPFKTGNKFH